MNKFEVKKIKKEISVIVFFLLLRIGTILEA